MIDNRMNTKANYLKIGLFVIAAIVVTVMTVVIVGAGMIGKDKVYLETYIDESVQGLSVGSPVKHRGVQIGRVDKITFVTREYDIPSDIENFAMFRRYVMVQVAADYEKIGSGNRQHVKREFGHLVENGLRIRLTSQALTGVAYLEADYLDPNRYPVLDIGWEPKHIYVPSAPSILSTFTQSAEEAFVRLGSLDFEGMVEKTSILLTTVNTAVEEAKIGQLSEEARRMFTEFRETNKKLQALLTTSQPGPASSANLPDMIERLDVSLARIDEFLRTQGNGIEDIIYNVREISVNIRELSEDIKKHPSKVLFGKPPAKSEIVK